MANIKKLFPRKNPYHGDNGGIDKGIPKAVGVEGPFPLCPECHSQFYIETLSFRVCRTCGFFRDLWAHNDQGEYKEHPEIVALVPPALVRNR